MRHNAMLKANSPSERMLHASCDVSEQELRFVEAAGADGKPKLKRFTGVAYTGGAMLANFGLPVAVDLEGLTAAAGSIPALLDHDPSQIVGHLSAEIGKRSVKVSGEVSGAGVTDAADKVAALSANSFPWQMSVGVMPTKVDRLDAGDKAIVNGRTVSGPAYVVRAGVLREVSFVAIGADGNTSASVAASFGKEQGQMTFEQWLKAKGFGELTLSAAQKETLKAAYDAEVKAAGNAAPPAPSQPPVAGDTRPDLKAGGQQIDIARELAELRTQLQNRDRLNERQAVLAQYRAEVPADQFTAIEAQATAGNWDRNGTELALLRARRPAGPAIHVRANDTSNDVLVAAACVAGNLRDVGKSFGDQVLQAAHNSFRRGISLQELMLTCAHRNGYAGFSFRGNEREILRAAFSTADIGGILSNVANKFLLAGYGSVEDTWRQIAAVRDVNDFKQSTSYRLVADAKFEQVGADNRIKHGSLSDESYTNRAKTYAKLFGVSREHIVNDDLGAISDLPFQIGRGGALKLNEVFWKEFLDNSTFFASGNSNYASGGTTVLSIDSLTAAELLFYNQTDPSGNPLGVIPKILLVPNALNVKASSYTRDLEIRDTTSSTKYTTSNPHAGKFTAVRSSYLSNASLTGYSTTAWYLLADPMDLPVIEVAFLYGVQSPTVETADADFDQLGVQMRGVFDFGAKKQAYRGGVKMAGA